MIEDAGYSIIFWFQLVGLFILGMSLILKNRETRSLLDDISTVLLVVTVVAHLLWSVIHGNLIGTLVDLAILYLWWRVLKDDPKWRRRKKRAHAKVVELAGRLKVVPVPVNA